jgi:hypothetical protein
MPLRIALFAIAAILLGAHFYRAGNYLLVALCLAVPLLFFHKRRLSLVILQLTAYAATAIWLEAAIRLVRFRQQMGEPWTAAAIILGGVALVTLAAGLMLNSRAIARRYPA